MFEQNKISKKKENEWNNLLKEYELKVKDVEMLNALGISALPFCATITGLIMPRADELSLSFALDFLIIFVICVTVVSSVLKYQYDLKLQFVINLEKQMKKAKNNSPFIYYSRLNSRFPLVSFIKDNSNACLITIVISAAGIFIVNFLHWYDNAYFPRASILLLLIAGLFSIDNWTQKKAFSSINNTLYSNNGKGRSVGTITEGEYIKDRLDDQIEWYSNKSQWHQKWYKRLKNTELVFSALIPIILMSFDGTESKIIAGSLGATIAVISGVHGHYNFHENWIDYRATSETLKHEKYMYQTKSGIYENCNFNLLVERSESIISKENVNWANSNKTTCKAPTPQHTQKEE